MKCHTLLAAILFLSLCGPALRAEEPVATLEPSEAPAAAIRPELKEQFFQAALEGRMDEVKALLEKGVSANAQDEGGRTALMLSCFNGHTELAKALLDAGADIHAAEGTGRTPLMFASTGPFSETVALLLERGARIDQADSGEQWTPIMFAAAEGQADVVRLLLERGADPALKDTDGDTARTFAIDRGHADVVGLLPAPSK